MIGRGDRIQFLLTVAMLVFLASCDSGAPEAPAGSTSGDASVPTNEAQTSNAVEQPPREAPERQVVSDRLPYAEVDEELVYGHFVFPADMVDPLPGVIVIHERWGLDDRTRALADRIAAQGYVVLAVDLYGGKMASDASGASGMMAELDANPELANENIRQAYQFLADSGQAPKVGVLGWSLGGTWALNAALLLPDSLDAVVMFYGQISDNEEQLALLEAPLLGLFGSEDRGVTADSVAAFRAALEGLGKDYEIEVYPNAGHAFADPNAPNYNADVAEAAWARAIAFLGRHLSAGTH
jgi:carboxymethylenebutenolidase